MSIKQTGHDLTCVRLIPSINDDRISFLTTDTSGQLSIYEKLTKSQRNTNSIKDSNNHNPNNPSNLSNNHKVQRKTRTNLSKNKLICASIIDAEHYIVASENEIFTVGSDFGSNGKVQTLKAASLPKNNNFQISTLSNLTPHHDRVFLSTNEGAIFSMELKTGQVKSYHDHGIPITKIVSFSSEERGSKTKVGGEFEQCFMTSDTRGQLNLFDSRCKSTVFQYKCGKAPALLSVAKTNNMYGSSSIIATGAENGQISFYDLRNQKANQRSLFDKQYPLPIYDLAFSKTDPSYLYTCGLDNITSIQSTMSPTINSGGDFIMEPWSENVSQPGSNNISLNSANGMETEVNNTVNIDSQQQSSQQQQQVFTKIPTKRTILHGSSVGACFTSLDINDNGDLVAVSDGGQIFYNKC